jgi:type 1 fimbriae regulatory protein FimB/type 1 fimbriae regulatory protein FimE
VNACDFHRALHGDAAGALQKYLALTSPVRARLLGVVLLRHACGYKLANDGHDTRAIQAYLGHRNIQNTTRYMALAPQRLKEFF